MREVHLFQWHSNEHCTSLFHSNDATARRTTQRNVIFPRAEGKGQMERWEGRRGDGRAGGGKGVHDDDVCWSSFSSDKALIALLMDATVAYKVPRRNKTTRKPGKLPPNANGRRPVPGRITHESYFRRARPLHPLAIPTCQGSECADPPTIRSISVHSFVLNALNIVFKSTRSRVAVLRG